MTKREKCEKYFWMHGADVVTKCPDCNYHFTVAVGIQFGNKGIIPVPCPRCHRNIARPVLKDHRTLAY